MPRVAGQDGGAVERNGRWYPRLPASVSPTRKVLTDQPFDFEEQAKARAAQIAAEMRGAPHAGQQVYTLAEGVAQFIEWASDHLEEKSIKGHRTDLARRIEPYDIGSMLLTEITRANVEDWIIAMAEDQKKAKEEARKRGTGKNLGKGHARRKALSLASLGFERGTRELSPTPVNPFKGASWKLPGAAGAAENQPRPVRLCSWGESRRLVLAAQQIKPESQKMLDRALIIEVLIWAGLRPAEAFSLAPGDVLSDPELDISRIVKRKGGQWLPGQPTKTGISATVPIPAQLHTKLLEVKARREAERKPLLWPADRAGRLNDTTFTRNIWDPACIMAGLGGDAVRDVPLYPPTDARHWFLRMKDLRASAASNLRLAKVQPEIAQEILRHRSYSTTRQHYVLARQMIDGDPHVIEVTEGTIPERLTALYDAWSKVLVVPPGPVPDLPPGGVRKTSI